jgi:hypothetical protein
VLLDGEQVVEGRHGVVTGGTVGPGAAGEVTGGGAALVGVSLGALAMVVVGRYRRVLR